ncbi:hypothetical protein MFUM_310048 [Methylacidiphilum fumariolicum SolV]|uniref:Uncharacterized protein n=2 Tax=Candidatus Methylacidiphilum fumarolicum TaxID=591154 RepID=I0JY07_METFB|nr:conserved protein of unknown function [Candidatus Methylacidiphilum fumarolicum]CCG92126.1 hypothetical protein MFUM_310048 [Methylacidiphilum fumariolicum SolV]
MEMRERGRDLLDRGDSQGLTGSVRFRMAPRSYAPLLGPNPSHKWANPSLCRKRC